MSDLTDKDRDAFNAAIRRLKTDPLHYTLDENKNPVPATLMEWAEFFEDINNRRVGYDYVGDVRVSTVFLGLDHGFGFSEQPLLFETMVFGGTHDDLQWRYYTWAEAVAGHKKALALVKRCARPWWRRWLP